MVWKSLLFIFCGVLLQEYISCRDMWSCTPSAPQRFVWISSHAQAVNISSPTTFSSNASVFCSWKIEAPQGYRIRIHFSSFSLINSVNCTEAVVEVSEKRGLLSIILGRYCGTNPPADVVTQESFVLLIYRAWNGSHQGHTGFHVTVSLAPAETCSLLNSPEANQNIVLSGSSGVFITPVFPRAYPTNIQCRWTITAPSGHRIELKFLAFDLGSSPQNGDCSKDDFVEVRDSDNKNDPSYGPLCGNAKPSPVLSVGPKMVVTFKSDEKKVFEGFFAKYDAIPEGVCTHNNSIVQLNLTRNATGHLSSPDYPFQFPPIGACYWRIKAPDGHRVKLQFTTMNISGNCEGDINDGEWVRVDDYFIGDFKSVTSFWGRFCSSASPPPIYSTRSELQVFFTSNYSINTDSEGLERFNSDQRRNHGFYATYEVIKQGFTSRCRTDHNQKEPIIVQGNTGTLVSPGYPYSYPVIICTWKIVVPKNYIMEVDFRDFELDCAGGSSLKVGEQNEFCGSKKPDNVLTSTSDLKFNMVIKKAGNYRGFRATFSLRERKPEVASIVPWVIIPIVLVAVGVTLCVVWKRRRNERDRGSSFRASIINRMRSQSSGSH